jgi:competence ComEA-like helix-hairpin-helix protein
VHTRAAELQSLHEHLLAYVKQNLLPAKSRVLLIPLLIFALALFPAACATQPQQARHASSEVQLNLEAPKSSRVSLININTAPPQELEKLPGVGKAIAERIVAHRAQYGLFRRTEHLMMVRGISDRKFREMRPMIVVD